jgi:hypothetical protein
MIVNGGSEWKNAISLFFIIYFPIFYQSCCSVGDGAERVHYAEDVHGEEQQPERLQVHLPRGTGLLQRNRQALQYSVFVSYYFASGFHPHTKLGKKYEELLGKCNVDRKKNFYRVSKHFCCYLSIYQI